MAVAPKHELLSFRAFEVDLDAGEIRKGGLRIRLPGQPFRLLATLLAHPGEVVSREELQREIWGSNTNVDFERGLAGAVNKLREALGDSAEHPVYVETLARKGYRFIAPVTVLSRPALLQPVAAPEPFPPAPAPALPELGVVSPPTLPSPPEKRSRRSLFGPAWALAGGLLVFAAAFVFWLSHRGPMQVPRVERLTHTTDIYPGPPNAETLLSIATDGPRLYVPTLVDGHSELSSFSINGAFQQRIALSSTLSNSAVSDISDDGSRLLVRSVVGRQPEQSLWVVPTAGGGAQRVGEVLAHDAVFLPHDPDRILFATGNSLRIVQLGTGAVVPFLSLPGRAFWMRWAPDGRTLRYTLLNPVDHTSQLWEMDVSSHKTLPLLFRELRDFALCCGSWTPDGSRFIFSVRDAEGSNVWAVSTGLFPRLTQLTNGPTRFYSPLAGRKGDVVFAFGTTESSVLQRFDLTRKVLTPASPFLADAERVSYSRDAVWVAWTDSRGRLWRARAGSGEDLLQLTGTGFEVFSVQWSPNGSELLLMARHTGAPWQIYRVSSSSGAITPLLVDRRNLADPGWSPDGREIVFGRQADLMGEESGSHDLQVLNLASHQLRSIEGSANLFSPRWSPDGRWIAALSRDQARLMLFDVATRHWSTLYTGGAADPVWSADSSSVSFHAFAREHPAILRVSLSGTVDVLTDLSGFGPSLPDNYFFSGLAADGSPLLKSRVGVGDLYAISLPESGVHSQR